MNPMQKIKRMLRNRTNTSLIIDQCWLNTPMPVTGMEQLSLYALLYSEMQRRRIHEFTGCTPSCTAFTYKGWPLRSHHSQRNSLNITFEWHRSFTSDVALVVRHIQRKHRKQIKTMTTRLMMFFVFYAKKLWFYAYFLRNNAYFCAILRIIIQWRRKQIG